MRTGLWVVLLLFSSPGFSQDWPKQKPVQIVVGFAPGATTDTVARIAAQKLQEALGQTFVVENRPGAGGNLATQQVKRAAADGYTVLVTSVAYAVNPSQCANALRRAEACRRRARDLTRPTSS
jgi:tripartite-type tricarboxylate transporter receptor subunit TctC